MSFVPELWRRWLTVISDDIDDDTTTQPDRKLPMQQQPPIAAPKAEAFSGSAAPPGLLPADFPPLATPSKPNLDSKGGSIPPVAADPHDISPESIVNPVSDASDFVTSVLPKRRKDESSLEDQRPSQKSLNKQTMDAESIQSSSKVDSKALGHSRQRSEPSVSAKHAQANLRSTSKTDSSATKTPKEVKSSGKQASKITVKEPIRSPTTGLDNPPQQDTPVSLDQITPVKPSASSTALDSPRPSSSGTSTSQQTTTSLPRNPRTLRLVPTTKIDVPQKPPMPVPEDNSSISIGARQASQQPSSASAKQPSTPINDFISDNASLTSASLSRPPSPPGTKGNTTPTSQKSKSQAKKERQARAKKLEETKFTEESTSSPVQEEVVQAPIIGRKKKSKKPQVTPAVAKLVDSEVSSPQVQEFSTKGKKEEEVKAAAVQPNKALEKKTTKLEEPEAEDVVLEPISVPAARPTINSASIFPELKKAGVATSRELDLFLNPTGLNSRFETHVRPDFKYEDLVSLTDLDKQVLDRGECITKKVGRLEYVVVLSDRSVLRHFSREEAQRYVDLRRECYASLASTFTSPEFPIDAWLNFTSNDLLSGYQVAPLLDSSDDEASLGSPEALVKEYGAGIMRPDSKDAQYASLYPPRTQSENDEIEARMTMMTVEEAEQTLKASEELLLATKKEAEQVEKKLQQTLKKNRKILKDFL
ncbi:transcriptional repressor general negative regulator of transcription subunit 4 [Thelotrema lepadinum]|nr:transcriptional repressor general negative regulator of transcription subunit 4 [Thelotrema lepadinum]